MSHHVQLVNLLLAQCQMLVTPLQDLARNLLPFVVLPVDDHEACGEGGRKGHSHPPVKTGPAQHSPSPFPFSPPPKTPRNQTTMKHSPVRGVQRGGGHILLRLACIVQQAPDVARIICEEVRRRHQALISQALLPPPPPRLQTVVLRTAERTTATIMNALPWCITLPCGIPGCRFHNGRPTSMLQPPIPCTALGGTATAAPSNDRNPSNCATQCHALL